MTTMQGALPDLADPAIYRHWTRVTIRFSDEDRMGHVNNAAYAVWLEASRVAYLESLYRPDETLDMVLARLTVDYLRETRWPGEVSVGARLTSLGNKSLRSVYGVFRDGVCLATCECVNVFFDPRARRAVAPPQAVREAMLAEIAASA
jgi:acyl-CoA thioester hydrolase